MCIPCEPQHVIIIYKYFDIYNIIKPILSLRASWLSSVEVLKTMTEIILAPNNHWLNYYDKKPRDVRFVGASVVS